MGILILHYINKKRVLSHEEFDFLKMLRNQAGTALYQAELYENTKKQAEREHLLRNILETIRGSLDINVIKNSIVTEIGKVLNVSICFIMLYNYAEDYFYVDEHSEYRSSPEEISFIGYDLKGQNVKWFADLFKQNKGLNFADVDEFIAENNLQGSPEALFLKGKEYDLRSSYNVSISHANKLLGYIILEYTKNPRKLEADDLEFLSIIATQAGIALHQAELYKITKVQAEREKISRNIIEILRSTLDKNIIKRLFVKNIGKFFNADRVIFSLYDQKTNTYLPADEGSEYLSSPAEKSFIDYDWSKSEAREFIQPLMEKRELLIYNWDEYVKSNHKGQDFIDLFENSDVKSSYNFPVVYQQKIMGFFCIEFTQAIRKLFDEDINIIRNICTQAGIALYHSDLYEEAQKNTQTHAKFLTKLSTELKTPINMIVEFSQLLLQSEFKHSEDLENLNKIYENAKKLLYLLDDTFQNINIKTDFD